MKEVKGFCKPYGLIALIFLCLFSAAAIAADFPSKPVTIVVGYSAGGSTDLQARIIASSAPEFLGQPVVVTCKPGGGGAVATAWITRQRLDGYLVLMVATPALVIKPHMTKLPYKLGDVIPIMRVGFSPRIVSVAIKHPFKNIHDLMEYAKKNPGALKFGSPGAGTGTHIEMETFCHLAGIKLTHVPFKGGAKSGAAAAGGHIDIHPATAGETLALAQAGKIRPIVVFSDKRLKELPDVPTLKEETGIDFAAGYESALWVAKGTPEDRIQILHEAFRKTLECKSAKKLFERIGDRIAYMSGKDLEPILVKKSEYYKKVLETIGLKKSGK
ncbi:MAG: tripartite tricarboxylate transporter substrate binding protein [Deltaproteobacteria bacterium]|nr:tripartite tricarboxylate transporter substrate binding protein [Deltaproteobacteria bacterium]MBW2154171.1 tripartite tricarboxylate transporter substrate binding protein [Deltaproteobacteria bacterium]